MLSSSLPALHRTAAALASSPTLPPRLGLFAVRAMGHGSRTSDNNPDVLAKEKQRNLEGRVPEVIPGEPGWNPGLASESEAVVRAERAPSIDMDELQRRTIETLGALDATHPDAAATGHPAPHEGPVEGAHDPSGAPAIKDNLRYDKRPEVAGQDPN